jgi:transcriptional regulator with XRE-family HTH domain
MFGEKLRMMRKRRGMSQIEACRKYNEDFGTISQTTWSNWEQRQHAPRGEIVKNLAETLDCQVVAFLDEPLYDEPLKAVQSHIDWLRSRIDELLEENIKLRALVQKEDSFSQEDKT